MHYVLKDARDQTVLTILGPNCICDGPLSCCCANKFAVSIEIIAQKEQFLCRYLERMDPAKLELFIRNMPVIVQRHTPVLTNFLIKV